MHILRDPSFFLTNKTRAPHGEILGLMKPLSSKSLSWSSNFLIQSEPSYMDELKWDLYLVTNQRPSQFPIQEELLEDY